MKRTIAITAWLAVLGLLGATVVLGQDGHKGHHGDAAGAATEAACDVCSARAQEAGNLAQLATQLRAAKAAADAEGAEDVAKKLAAAVATIEARHKALHAAMATHMEKAHPGSEMPQCPLCAETKSAGASGLANTRCPMMGGEVDPAKATGDLVREFEGKKIGFCCGGCPAKWDRLTVAQKRERLAKVMTHDQAAPEGGGSGGCCGD